MTVSSEALPFGDSWFPASGSLERAGGAEAVEIGLEPAEDVVIDVCEIKSDEFGGAVVGKCDDGRLEDLDCLTGLVVGEL